jgi:hypothetical protein
VLLQKYGNRRAGKLSCEAAASGSFSLHRLPSRKDKENLVRRGQKNEK